jgi:LacI family transcriptional regulator
MTRVSLTEVARASGVSLASASRALNPNNGHPVSADVRERVQAAAAELNYSVNALARGIKTGRNRTVAVLVHDICDPYFNLMARGVTDAADAAGYLTLVCNSERDPDTELRYVQLALEQRVAGVLFVGGGFASRRYGAALHKQRAALADYGAHTVALGPRASRMPSEVPDSRGGALQATEHLLELGHERIAFIDGPPEILTSKQRRDGYRDALEAAGIAFDEELVIPGGFTKDGGAAAVQALLNRGTDFTAVFTASDQMAIGCLAELSARGIRIPADVSLVGFDDIPDVRWFAPPLTTVAVPMTTIGEAGMQRLLALLDDPDEVAGRQRLVNVHPTELIVRGSTAAPRARSRNPKQAKEFA